LLPHGAALATRALSVDASAALGDLFSVAGAAGERDHRAHGIADRDCRCS
jgi:hypothetical protein